jgi:hypothetical protein
VNLPISSTLIALTLLGSPLVPKVAATLAAAAEAMDQVVALNNLGVSITKS